MRIALLGAQATGKTSLAEGLAAWLRQRGHAVTLLSDVLREWCGETGRTPRQDEQSAIAHEQAHRSELAAQEAGIVVADTTPLMLAVASEQFFGDSSLYDFALTHQRSYALTLVTGLDLPRQAHGRPGADPQAREPADALLRAALLRGGIAFQTIYGNGQARLAAVVHAVEQGLPALRVTSAGEQDAPARPWVWLCEKCSDPECEHRLFSQRLAEDRLR